MDVKASFCVSGLQEALQNEILSRREPQFVYITHRGIRLCFVGDWSQRKTPELGTMFYIDLLDGLNSKVPVWLKDVEVELSLDDRFFGYLPNGIFRYGRAKVVVSTGIDCVEISDDIVATCVNITGRGPAKQVLDQAIKLYRLVRANLLEDKHVVERWPVQAPDDRKWLTYGQGVEAEAVPETELPDED